MREALHAYAVLLTTIEHAERQFRKAQMAGTDQNGHSTRWHHKDKSKALYAKAREHEREVHDLQPQFTLFGEELPRHDSPRKHHCRRMKAYWVANRKEMENQLRQAESDLETVEREMGEAKAELRRTRCAIMEETVPPPQYQKKA